MNNINAREAAALIQSLSAGVVPRIGLRHIAVGRKTEVDTFLQDLHTVQEGGSFFRLICGQYGSGKSFLLQMIRTYAMDKNFVVLDADLSPERRLTGTQKQGLRTYRELLQHMAVKTRPEGGALEAILQRWLMKLQSQVRQQTQELPGSPAFTALLNEAIRQDLDSLSLMAFGFSFIQVVQLYAQSIQTGDDALRNNCLRWLRGEYNTKTDARKDLPVDAIIGDGSWYDFLKLLAAFSVLAGYAGLVIFLDEGVNLYKITHKMSRESNYEKLLTLFNDTMQGKAGHIGFFLSGTPEFVYDESRGLFSYEALRSRLSLNRFAQEGFVDYAGPVITLQTLRPEELYVLLERLMLLHAQYYKTVPALDSSQIQSFLQGALSRIGADTLLTPREITRDFLGLLNILAQDPSQTFASLMASGYQVQTVQEAESIQAGADAVFTDLKL